MRGLKNPNSLKSAVKAIEFEENRHRQLLGQDKNTHRETRRWDEVEERTQIMRFKAAEDEYRYFPETDIMPIVLSEEEITEIKRSLPENNIFVFCIT